MLCPIAEIAKINPDQLALIENGNEFSYLKLDNMIDSYQSYLLKNGISSNDKVAIIGSNGINYIAILFAIWRIDAIAFPVNPTTPFDNINKTLKKSKTAFLIYIGIDLKDAGNKNVKLINGSIDEVSNGNLGKQVSKIDENNHSLLIQTSGSTSESKIVVLSFSNLYYSALGVLDRIELQRGDRWLLSLPLFHVGGIGVLIRCFLKGAVVVILNKKKSLFENIRKNKISHLSLVSTQLYKLIDEIKRAENNEVDIKSVLLGSSIPVDLKQESLKLDLPVYVSYGLSEMSSTVSISKLKQNDSFFYSSGTLLKYRDVWISKNNEILLRGRTLFKGYLRDGLLELSVDKDGWFKTGDLGYLDDNKELIITGRKDNMFISGGENIQPEEIERILLEIPGVLDSKVLPVEDIKFGFRPVAFLKTNDGKLPDKKLIRRKLIRKLPKFKIPDAFYPWPEIDRNSIKLKERISEPFEKHG